MIEAGKDGVPKRTKAQAKALFRLKERMLRLERDLHHAYHFRDHIPMEWSCIHENYSEQKVRITMRVDEGVVKFFRSMGPRYQVRMNDVLQSYVQARLAGFIMEEADEIAHYDREEAEKHAKDVASGESLRRYLGK